MKVLKKHSFYLIWAIWFLAGSHFTWFAFPSSYSDDHAFQSRAVLGNAISHPKFRTPMQYAGYN